jgi:hypothetical protein
MLRSTLLDEWGLAKLNAAQRNDLMVLIGEATLADAILDRLPHNAHRLALSRESMRRAALQPETTAQGMNRSDTPGNAVPTPGVGWTRLRRDGC